MNMMIDAETLGYIRAVAARLFEGNRSQAVRYLVREGYVARMVKAQPESLPYSDLPADAE